MAKKESFLTGYLNKIALFTTAISILTFAIGCFIINVNLSSYQLQDFDLIKPRAVYVGLTFLLLLAFNISIYFLVPERMKEASMNQINIKRYNTLKGCFTAIILYFFAKNELATSDYCVFNFLGKHYDIKPWVTCCIIISIILYIGFDNAKDHKLWQRIKSADKVKDFCHSAIYYIMLVPLATLILLYLPVIEFALILLLQLVIGWWVSEMQIEESEKASTEIGHLIEGGYPDQYEYEYDNIDLFDEMISNVKEKTRDFFEKFEKPASGVVGIFLFLLLLTTYSYNFYPLIPQSVGGGRLESIKYITEKDTVLGKKVYETENFVFILRKDQTITKLDWEDINKIVSQE